MSIVQSSLSDPQSASVITPAAHWVTDLLFGPLATSIAVIAIAWIGFAMLAGRVDIRRGLMVILGCFLLFGARTLAEGLRSTVAGGSGVVASAEPLSPVYPAVDPKPAGLDPYDPYAGAAVLQSYE